MVGGGGWGWVESAVERCACRGWGRVRARRGGRPNTTQTRPPTQSTRPPQKRTERGAVGEEVSQEKGVAGRSGPGVGKDEGSGIITDRPGRGGGEGVGVGLGRGGGGRWYGQGGGGGGGGRWRGRWGGFAERRLGAIHA